MAEYEFLNILETKMFRHIADYFKGKGITHNEVEKVLSTIDFDELENTFRVGNIIGFTFTQEEQRILLQHVPQLYDFCNLYHEKLYATKDEMISVLFQENLFTIYNIVWCSIIFDPLENNMLSILPNILHEF